ncbi:MAG: translation elongation factor Ts [Planctomycetota bacterium]
MTISSDDVKRLRDQTGAGVLACRAALQETKGDFDEAVKELRKKGAALAAKRADREAGEGIIGIYLHHNKKVASMVEVNCETDFAGRSEKLVEFARELAMHVTAYNPRWITPEEVPAKVIEDEKEVYRAQLAQENKPANIVEKILEGKLKKFYEQTCLLKQAYSGNEQITVEQAVQELTGTIGEKIKISRFTRYAIGAQG